MLIQKKSDTPQREMSGFFLLKKNTQLFVLYVLKRIFAFV